MGGNSVAKKTKLMAVHGVGPASTETARARAVYWTDGESPSTNTGPPSIPVTAVRAVEPSGASTSISYRSAGAKPSTSTKTPSAPLLLMESPYGATFCARRAALTNADAGIVSKTVAGSPGPPGRTHFSRATASPAASNVSSVNGIWLPAAHSNVRFDSRWAAAWGPGSLMTSTFWIQSTAPSSDSVTNE